MWTFLASTCRWDLSRCFPSCNFCFLWQWTLGRDPQEFRCRSIFWVSKSKAVTPSQVKRQTDLWPKHQMNSPWAYKWHLEGHRPSCCLPRRQVASGYRVFWYCSRRRTRPSEAWGLPSWTRCRVVSQATSTPSVRLELLHTARVKQDRIQTVSARWQTLRSCRGCCREGASCWPGTKGRSRM